MGKSKGVKGELFLGSNLDSNSVFFSPDLSERITDFGLSIDLDLYPPDNVKNRKNF